MTFSASWAARARQTVSQPPAKSEDCSDSDESRSEIGEEVRKQISPVSRKLLATVVVFGADGDLAKKKILPTLFNIWRRKLVPRDILIFGYARSPMTDELFRKHIFKCIYHPSQPQGDRKEFLLRCHYQAGQFDDPETMGELIAQMEAKEEERRGQRKLPQIEQAALAEADEPGEAGGTGTESGSTGPAQQVRLYYMAVPPFLYAGICSAMRSKRRPKEGPLLWSLDSGQDTGIVERFVLEKPFGKDTASCKVLVRQLSMLREEEIFRIDHYLGKELVMNLLVLRFANVCFQAIWNRQHIKNVQVIFKEDFGVEGRGGYFDEYGIIRDVLQNHLLQVMALVCMEQPLSFSAEDIRLEKLKVLRQTAPLTLDNLVTGQYVQCGKHKGYLDEPTVLNKESTTETFAAAVLHVHNPRWEGVPFVLKAGKALTDRKAEVRIQFHRVPGVVAALANCQANELVVRLQPEETIYWKVQNKVPGLGFEVQQIRMDLLYASKFQKAKLPEAYERLLLDVLAGQHSNFVSADELLLSWEIFTPVLHQLEEEKIKPEPYPYGSRGPPGADALANRFGMPKFGGGLHPAVEGRVAGPQNKREAPPTAEVASAMMALNTAGSKA
mmetsp:Transcript_1872/g.5845  ORF Transcript_1872/g.5845 Transcript_1872/m.5845 type:complete len:612 (-) Transcript_1872:319-2154(-)